MRITSASKARDPSCIGTKPTTAGWISSGTCLTPGSFPQGLAFHGSGWSALFLGNGRRRYIYAADAPSGRGFFISSSQFPNPERGDDWGLAFGDDSLWVSEGTPGPDSSAPGECHQESGRPLRGTTDPRHLIMTIETEPEKDQRTRARPITTTPAPTPTSSAQQGVWPETEKFVDVSEAPNATIKHFTYDPAGDASSRPVHELRRISPMPRPDLLLPVRNRHLDQSPTGNLSILTASNRITDALEGTDYLADDPELFNLTDTETYDDLIREGQSSYRGELRRPGRHEESLLGRPQRRSNTSRTTTTTPAAPNGNRRPSTTTGSTTTPTPAT